MKEFFKKEYPKMLLLSKRHTFSDNVPIFKTIIVYNKTAYDSVVKRWGARVDINERRPKLSELKKHFILKRVWFAMPNWLAGAIVYLAGLFTKDFIKIGQSILGLLGLK